MMGQAFQYKAIEIAEGFGRVTMPKVVPPADEKTIHAADQFRLWREALASMDQQTTLSRARASAFFDGRTFR